ncbi:hypothetical protein PCLA_20r0037 [Pseudomonas citronellolis]|nr:hypothetical protein PCLA_20r0037 [Pseudomonas citronellolis]
MGTCPTDEDLVHSGLAWRAKTAEYTFPRQYAAKWRVCAVGRQGC